MAFERTWGLTVNTKTKTAKSTSVKIEEGLQDEDNKLASELINRPVGLVVIGIRRFQGRTLVEVSVPEVLKPSRFCQQLDEYVRNVVGGKTGIERDLTEVMKKQRVTRLILLADMSSATEEMIISSIDEVLRAHAKNIDRTSAFLKDVGIVRLLLEGDLGDLKWVERQQLDLHSACVDSAIESLTRRISEFPSDLQDALQLVLAELSSKRDQRGETEGASKPDVRALDLAGHEIGGRGKTPHKTDKLTIESLREKMRLAYENSGLTLEEIGIRMGYESTSARQNIRTLLTRSKNPGALTVSDFASAIGISMSDLVSSHWPSDSTT